MGNTPLHDASEANQVEVVKKLIQQDAAVNYTNRKQVRAIPILAKYLLVSLRLFHNLNITFNLLYTGLKERLCIEIKVFSTILVITFC